MPPASPLHASSGPDRRTANATEVRRALQDLRVQLEATEASLELLVGELRAGTSAPATTRAPGPGDLDPV